MKTKLGIKGISFSLLSLFVGAAAWAQVAESDLNRDHTGESSTGKVQASGGALNVKGQNIESIKGNFTGNYVETDYANKAPGETTGSAASYGGAIGADNRSGPYTIGSIEGNFENNYAKSNGQGAMAWGGAIIFANTSSDSINGNFTGNKVEATSDTSNVSVGGGALYIQVGNDKIGVITGNFESNQAVAIASEGFSVDAKGGAIYNSGTISSLKGDVRNNAIIVTDGKTDNNNQNGGGAIYNHGRTAPTLNLEGNIEGNYIESNTSDYYGGAIYNGGNIKISANESDLSIKGNYVKVNGELSDAQGGFLYARGGSTTTFDVSDGRNIIIGDGTSGYDSLASESGAKIVKSGSGTLTVNSSMAEFNGILNVSGGVMNVNNGLGAEKTLVENAELNIDGANLSNKTTVSDDFGPRLALVQAGNGSTLNVTSSTFEGNYAKSSNTVNGTYGVAISSSGAKEVSIDNVKFNSNQVESESMAQGIVYISGTENASIKNSEFVGNKSGQESGTSYSAGVVSLWGNQSVSIEGSKFENNYMKASTPDGYADGGAIYARGAAWGGHNPSELKISDSSFSGNTLESALSSRGGAIFVKSDISAEGGDKLINAEIVDSTFTGNKSITTDAENAYGDQGGGAIYNQNSTLKIVANNDITNVGNQAIVGGSADDSKGGFLYMYSGEEANGTPKTEFAVAENATLTIGDGTAGQDSIASNDSNSIITKTGAGTLTVNGSMADYKGTLNVSEGVMNVNNGLGGEANVSGADLNIANANYDGLSLVKPANGSPTAIVNATAGADLTLKDSSFKNNTVSTEGTANGTYGVAVGINSSNATIDNVVFENNTSKSTGSLMSQGVVYLTVSESTSIKNSHFVANKSESENGAAMGGAISSFGSNLDIENTEFTGNSVAGTSADGSAVYVAGNDWGGVENAVVNISNSKFSNNVSEGRDISRGAVFAGGDNANSLTVNITDSVFTNNVAKGNSYVAGGAISVQDQQVNINVSKDMTYVGNQAIVNGVADDSRGGFLFINSKNVSSDTTFNISEGAALTIGDGRVGYDSIASRDEKAVINKTGSGTLTVNSSMEYFTGSLAVNQGEMNVANKLGASSVSIANGAVLKLSVGNGTVLTNEALTLSNSGTLALIARGVESGKIAAADGLDFGNVAVYGGTFDAASGVFTSGDNMELSYGNMGGSSFDGAATMKFYDETSSLTIISQGAISFGENVRNDSIAADFFGEDLLGAWSVSYNTDESIVMSFMLDSDITSASLYHQNSDGTWEKLESWLGDGAINAITGEMGNFALAVPEPSTYALIFGAFALVFVISRRRK